MKNVSIDTAIKAPMTKKEIAKIAEQDVKALIEDGYTDPLTMYATLKRAEAFTASAIKTLKPYAIQEVEQYGKEAEKENVKFAVYNTADALDFESDVEYKRLKDEYERLKAEYLGEIEKKIKDRERLLKAAYENYKNGINAIIVDEDGAEVRVPKIKRHGGAAIRVTY